CGPPRVRTARWPPVRSESRSMPGRRTWRPANPRPVIRAGDCSYHQGRMRLVRRTARPWPERPLPRVHCPPHRAGPSQGTWRRGPVPGTLRSDAGTVRMDAKRAEGLDDPGVGTHRGRGRFATAPVLCLFDPDRAVRDRPVAGEAAEELVGPVPLDGA